MEHNTYSVTGNEDESVDVLLICALKDEYDQVCLVTEGIIDPGWIEKIGPSGYVVSDGQFLTKTGKPLTIRATWAEHMGREKVQALASKLISDQPTRCIAMSGICAGRREDVALGDVIFADRLWSYDAGKTTVENGEQRFEGDMYQYRPAKFWVQRMQNTSPLSDAPWLAHRPRLPLEHQEYWVLLRILANESPQHHDDFSVACPNWSDVIPRLIKKRKWLDQSLSLTPAGREKAEELELLYPQELPAPAKFSVHVAPIATGAAVTEDDGIFSRLAQSQRKILGIEMEASAIAALGEVHEIPVVVAKGVSDYGDPFKDNRYRDFAARASAECLIDLLRNTTDLLPKLDAEVNSGATIIAQDGVASIHEHLDEINQGMEKVVGLYGNEGVLADHHGSDALQVLQGILKRRTSFGQDTFGDLKQLVNDTGDNGKFRAAPTSIRIEIYEWTARVAASKDMLQEAEKAIAMVSELGGEISQVVLAWCDVARGDIDAGLKRLRDFNDADSRSNLFAILRTKKGNNEALAYFESIGNITPDQFTAFGWRNVIACLAEAKRVDEAANTYMSLPNNLVADCPSLGYIGGVVCTALLVPEDHQHRVVYEEFFAANEHLLEGEDVDLWRLRARAAFQLSVDMAIDANDSGLEKSAKGWLRWLRLIDPVYKQEELALLIDDTKDGKEAVDLIPLAVAFKAKFDPLPLEKHLTRSEALGGLSSKELHAKLMLLRYFERFDELIHFIEDNWERLIETSESASLGGALIDALVKIGECSRAEEIIDDKTIQLYPLDIPRYKLMIEHCRGEDPTQHAKENYESSGAIEDLWNLVMGLETRQRWTELKPFALSLFEREQNAENALRYIRCLHHTKAPEEDIVSFLNKRLDLVERNVSLKSAQAWSLYHLGEVEEARKLNDQLLEKRQNVDDLGLDINITSRMGDWDKFLDIIAREWEHRKELPAHMLLHMAKLAGWRSKERAIQLAQDAVEKHPDDPIVLMQAYGVVAALARDDIAMPWLYRASQLSKDNEGPIQSYSYREMLELMKDQGDGWQRKNDLFRDGKIPMHWAASMFNVPLSHFLIEIPRANKDQVDARKRFPVPVWSGARQPIDTVDVRSLFLDITSIFILSELDILDRVFNVVDQVFISPRIMEVLLYESEKVAFHQPSRITEAKPLLELYRNNRIKIINDSGPKVLVDEVGEEAAALLDKAKQSNGLCIHSGKLYQVGSYLDVEANLGEYSNFISTPSVITHTLHDEGRITSSILNEALIYFNRVSNDEASIVKFTAGAPVFLDRVSTQYLAEAGLLVELINSGRDVFVHASAVQEWEALVATEPHTKTMLEALDNTRNVLRKGLADNKVKFVSEGKKDEDNERINIIAMPVIDLFEIGGRVDAVCIDDRFLNSAPFFKDRKGLQVPLLCSLDLINMLVARKKMTEAERLEVIHLMREWTMFAMPVDENELLRLLSARGLDENKELSEGAELRVIREYLARLHSAEVLCNAPELDYLDKLWQKGQIVIDKLWSDEASEVEIIVVKADWVVDHVIPDIELAMRFAPERESRLEEIAIARLQTALFPPDIPDDRRRAYAKWYEQRVIAPYLPANSHIIQQLIVQTSVWVESKVKEVVRELEKSGD